MGPKVFLAMPDACGLHPATGPTLNNGLVPDLYAGGAYDEYPGVTGSVLSYCLSYFLSASWMLARAAEPVSVVILIYLTR